MGCEDVGMLRGRLLGHLSVLCPAGAEGAGARASPRAAESPGVRSSGSTEETARGTRDEAFISVD